MSEILHSLIRDISRINNVKIYGTVASIRGMLVQLEGLSGLAAIGAICIVYDQSGGKSYAEVVAISENFTSVILHDQTFGVAVGCRAELYQKSLQINPDESWLGRVINAMGEPIDSGPELHRGSKVYKLHESPPPAHKRRKLGGKLDLGVKCLNTFTTCCIGQRMGIFAGSGVGKSVLISMMTKYSKADIKIIGLIGERGREVREFLDDYLGPEGLKNAIVVVATGDESPVLRRQAAYLTLTLCEYFRDLGKEVLCMLDSVTRYAMAQREIGLNIGEPPTTKGYPPSIFSELPRLLERAGPGTKEQGNITGFFSVLVEGDDMNDPIADTVRGILDGHIVMDRSIAERGRFPAVDVLKSISRTMPNCNSAKENELISKAKEIISTYTNMEELIRIGAYRKGSNKEVDNAIDIMPNINKFLTQYPNENFSLDECYNALSDTISNS